MYCNVYSAYILCLSDNDFEFKHIATFFFRLEPYCQKLVLYLRSTLYDTIVIVINAILCRLDGKFSLCLDLKLKTFAFSE